jgi:hypothetical protein
MKKKKPKRKGFYLFGMKFKATVTVMYVVMMIMGLKSAYFGHGEETTLTIFWAITASAEGIQSSVEEWQHKRKYGFVKPKLRQVRK